MIEFRPFFEPRLKTDFEPMYTASQIKELIEAALPDADVQVEGDDGQHFAARVESASFTGKSVIEQHRMVYAALGERMGEEIHALSLRTVAPKAD